MLSAIRDVGAGRFPFGGLPLSRLTRSLNLLLVVMLAYTLAQITWLLVPGSADSRAVPAVIVAKASSPAKATNVSLDKVATLHLLGRSDAPAPVEKEKPIDAPETRLNLTLRGLLALDSQQGARAIIAQGSGDEQSYRVGESVPGGAILHEIHVDRVILERGGRFETLTLPTEKMSMANTSAQGARPALGGRGGMVATPTADPRQLQILRETILKNPQEAMQLINAQPVMVGGQMKGYRVNPGRDRKLFSSVGLRPGDIITNVNGISLNDMSQMGALFQQLSSASRLDVTLERRGKQSQLSLGLE